MREDEVCAIAYLLADAAILVKTILGLLTLPELNAQCDVEDLFPSSKNLLVSKMAVHVDSNRRTIRSSRDFCQVRWRLEVMTVRSCLRASSLWLGETASSSECENEEMNQKMDGVHNQ